MKNNGVDPVLANIFDFVWMIVWLALVSVWTLARGPVGLVITAIEAITDVQHTGE
jgi:hypothetical protein